jgi:hypothetical protein
MYLYCLKMIHQTTDSFYRKIISPDFFYRMPFDRKVNKPDGIYPNAVWPKVHFTERLFNWNFRLTKSSFKKKKMKKVGQRVIWPKLHFNERSFVRKKLKKFGWPNLQKNMAFNRKFIWPKTKVHLSKKAFGQINFQPNYISVKWPKFQISFSVKFSHFPFFSMKRLLVKKKSVQWPFSIKLTFDQTVFGLMAIRPNYLSVKWRSVKNYVRSSVVSGRRRSFQILR